MMPRDIPPQFPSHDTCQALAGLTLEQLPQDGSLGSIRRYRKGARIWRPADRADGIFFLRHGRVAVMTSDRRGHDVMLQVIAASEPFGELCFCAQERGLRHTTSRAIVASEALEIRYTDFVDYLQHNRTALTRLVFTFCERLSETERRIEVLAYRGAEDRLGRLLLQLAVTPGEEGGEVVLHASHDELAHMAAMSRPHVTVTMGKFRRLGLVQYGRSQALVVNVPALKAYLDSIEQR